MSSIRRRTLLVATWLLSLVAANYVGGVIGFTQGYGTELALSGHDALLRVAVLRQLRGGSVDGAISLLESQLNSDIASAVFGENDYDSLYNLRMRVVFGNSPVEGNAWALSTVLEYREEFPFIYEDAAFRAQMMDALEAYRNAPKPDLSHAMTQ